MTEPVAEGDDRDADSPGRRSCSTKKSPRIHRHQSIPSRRDQNLKEPYSSSKKCGSFRLEPTATGDLDEKSERGATAGRLVATAVAPAPKNACGSTFTHPSHRTGTRTLKRRTQLLQCAQRLLLAAANDRQPPPTRPASKR